MIQYKPDTVNIVDIADYCKAVRATLRHWLALHTDAEAWAFDWFRLGPDVGIREALDAMRDKETGQIVIECKAIGWMEDIVPLVLHKYAYTEPDCFEQCLVCGEIAENGFLNCSCCDDVEVPDSADLLRWMEEIGYKIDNVPYRIIVATILGPVFEGYRKSVVWLTDGIEVETKDCLQDIDAATTVEEYIAAITWAAHVQHVGGGMVECYGAACGLDFGLFDRVQQNGLVAEFGDEAWAEFIDDWRNPSTITWRNPYAGKR